MTVFDRHPIPRPQSAFSLIEIVGVLAIISLLTSVAAPSIIQTIDRSRIAAEAKELPNLGDTLERRILRTKSIPGHDWAKVVADELAVPPERVTTSFARIPRVLLWDPSLRIGTATDTLPYSQGTAGSEIAPRSARIMLVSSQGRPLPKEIVTGVAARQDIFDNIWNAQRNTVPPGWPAEWAGKGEDLQVHRINLAPLFRRLVVSDLSEARDAEISIDGSPPFRIPAEGWSGHYFEGTTISLFGNGELASQQILVEDSSFVYERGNWRGQLWEGKGKDPTRLATALDDFLTARTNGRSFRGADQQSVIDEYYNFVLNYSAWARAGFPAYDASNNLTPEYQALINAQNRMSAASGDLIQK